MRLVKVLGVALVAVFAFAAMAVQGASAHLFESTKVPGLLLASADGPQLFITLAGHLVCNSLKGHGIVTTAKALTQIATVSYTSCSALVKGGALGTVAEPINTEYEFNADGTVSILKDVTILVTATGLKCTILVLPQSGLSTVAYDNRGSEPTREILILSHVREILNSATGSVCAEQYSHSKTGLYRGNAFVAVDGGEVSWT
jgi:hypothetical protein